MKSFKQFKTFSNKVLDANETYHYKYSSFLSAVYFFLQIHKKKKLVFASGACLDIFQKGFTNYFVLNLPLMYAYLRYALPLKYALCVLRNIYPKQSVFKMLFTS